MTNSAGRQYFSNKSVRDKLGMGFCEPGGSALSRDLDQSPTSRRRAFMGLPKDFVIRSLRHTMLTRLGESRVDADAVTVVRIAGSIAISQRYVDPTAEAVERAFLRLQDVAEVELPVRKRLRPGANSATSEERPLLSY